MRFFALVVLAFLTVSLPVRADHGNHITVHPSAKNIPEIVQGVQEHWRFLHERARESGRADAMRKYTDERMASNDFGVSEALKARPRHEAGTGKVLILGGASETSLDPLLAEFAEVDVVDLSPITLSDIDQKYREHKHYHRLRLHQADLSGIPVNYQLKMFSQMKAPAGSKPAAEAVDAYFRNFPKKLTAINFPSNSYDLVLSLVVAEYLPYAPVVAAFEKTRAETKEKRKAIDDLMGEPFFYKPEVRATFKEVLTHHRDELLRVARPGGQVLFSAWKRPDEKQVQIAPTVTEKLVRVGDDRMTVAEWDAFFTPFKNVKTLQSEHKGPNPNSILNLFLMQKGSDRALSE